MTAVPAQPELKPPAHIDVNVVYTLSKQDFTKAVTYARAAGQAYAPLNVTLTAVCAA